MNEIQYYEQRNKEKEFEDSIKHSLDNQANLIKLVLESVDKSKKNQIKNERYNLKNKLKIMETGLLLKDFEKGQRKFLEEFKGEIDKKLHGLRAAPGPDIM